ncbi:hypothetical protein S40293_10231, partial [Stachybotrys chartarum IBT 40293]
CSGQLPCDRCVSRDEPCNYQDQVWRTKDDLRSEISKLQDGVIQVLTLLERVTAAQNKSGLEPELVLQIKQGTVFDNAMRMLGIKYSVTENAISFGEIDGNGSHGNPNISTPGLSPEQVPAQPLNDHSTCFNNTASTSSFYTTPSDMCSRLYASRWSKAATTSSASSPLTGSPKSTASKLRSTSLVHVSLPPPTSQPACAGDVVTSDELIAYPNSQCVVSAQWELLNIDADDMHEVIEVYLSWELAGYSAICREPFLKDLSIQRRRFCSEALVCAVMARGYQMMECTGRNVQEYLIARLYNRAQTLLTMERAALETKYPHIQTLTILASMDVVAGRMDLAWKKAFEAARLAILDALENKGQPPVDEEHLSVRANAFCAAISLPGLLRLVLMKVEPMSAPLFMRLGPDSNETPESRIERGILLQSHFWDLIRWCPSHNAFSWEVTQHAHTYMMFHFDESSVKQNKADLFELYPKLQECWERSTTLPEDCELSPNKIHNCIQYHYSILSIFKPYMDDRAPESTISPRAVLATSAQAILDLAWLFKENWGLGLVHLGFPYIVGTATVVTVALKNSADGNRASTEMACKGVMMLAELALHHHAAKTFLAVVSKVY